MSFRYQPRIVSGLAMQATWARALHPSRLPISAKVLLCGSDNRKKEGRWARKILVLQQQFLIDEPGDVSEQPRPFVFFHLDGP